ncbi:hypothetical protein PF008_g6216 [Phytophthora fragariae]|uniref:Uncharacterized protein n=1 Tax=Phytophthora fragariae TaxID=53985 RepID=A0A6G0S7Q2_9STRA|nr:hypothetical protein PF008_g6216 [Phytophthora fragariae]
MAPSSDAASVPCPSLPGLVAVVSRVCSALGVPVATATTISTVDLLLLVLLRLRWTCSRLPSNGTPPTPRSDIEGGEVTVFH